MMVKPKSAGLTAADAQLLESIDTLLADNSNEIMLPMTALNQGIAKLSVENAKAITQIQGRLVKDIERHAVTSDNEIDALSMAILAPLQGWQDENLLLLTQLASAAGLTQPGDPLESALVAQVADAPELAYSATLLIAMRDALPHLAEIVIALREIRDRLPLAPVRFPGEIPDASQIDDNGSGVDAEGWWEGPEA